MSRIGEIMIKAKCGDMCQVPNEKVKAIRQSCRRKLVGVGMHIAKEGWMVGSG